MYQQLYERFDSILSPKQCVFRKGYSTQHYLMVILEKLKESKDRGGGGEGGATLKLYSLTFLKQLIVQMITIY